MKLAGTLFGAAVVLGVCFLIGAICWPYTINTWLVFFGKSPVVTWWEGGLLGFVPGIGQMSLPAAVITWILKLFLK